MYSTDKGLDLASKIFHQINRALPLDQIPLKLPPNCPARKAIEKMKIHGCSEALVVKGDEVLGVFSLLTFARGAYSASFEDCKRRNSAPGDLPVDQFIEKPKFARVTDD